VSTDKPGGRDVEHDRGEHPEAGPTIDMRGLDDRKRLAASLLAAGTPKVEIAKRLEISEVTLWRWERQAPFGAYLDQVRRDVLQQTIDAARSAAQLAVHTVSDAMLEGNADVAIKFLGLIGAGRVQIASDGAHMERTSGALMPELREGTDDRTD
jgi:hypothetical protein